MFRLGLALVAALLATQVHAHGGGLNAAGCHNDRKNGGYHCHRKQSGVGAAPGKVRSFVARAAGGAYYPNCSAARAAGAAPIRRGDDGYSRKLDRDGDGVACE
jgi:hypothetical protein